MWSCCTSESVLQKVIPEYFTISTPTCDLEQKRASHVATGYNSTFNISLCSTIEFVIKKELPPFRDFKDFSGFIVYTLHV